MLLKFCESGGYVGMPWGVCEASALWYVGMHKSRSNDPRIPIPLGHSCEIDFVHTMMDFLELMIRVQYYSSDPEARICSPRYHESTHPKRILNKIDF